MKITKIEAQVKQKGRYSIFVDDVFAFGISELGLINAGYRVGQELSPAELDSYKEDAAQDKLYNRVLGLIARRPRSIWEVQTYLARKDADPATISEIINRLTAKKFLDDQDFAQRWIESRRLLKPTSRRKLELELRTKRVSDHIIQTVLNQDDASDFDMLVQEVTRKRRQTRYQDDQKLMQYLARQGYAYEDIKRALANYAGDGA